MNRILALALCLSPLFLIKAQTLTIPQLTAPTIDGQYNSIEWQGATERYIRQAGGDSTRVQLLHDGANLYVSFSGHLESGTVLFPEILADVNYDRSMQWQNDDWWFHVSATDCEYQGQYGNFDSCAAQRPNWTAMPNFQPGGANTDTVEVSIPFSTLNLNYPNEDTIGLALLLTNTVNTYEFWPMVSGRLNPSSWGTAVFETSIGLEENFAESFSVYPNPSRGALFIQTAENLTSCEVKILDLSGVQCYSNSVVFDNGKIELRHNLPAGTYLLQIEGEQFHKSKRFVVCK